MMTEEKAKALVKEIIETKFPEINSRTIKVRFALSENFYGNLRWRIFYNYLYLNTKFFFYPETAIRAIVSHELAHIIERRRFLRTILPWLYRYLKARLGRGVYPDMSENWEDEMEREVDRMAVERGFGNDLLALHDEHEKYTGMPLESEFRLSRKEIRQLMEKPAAII